MVVNFCGPNPIAGNTTTSNQFNLNSEETLAQSQLREQLCAIQNQQASIPTLDTTSSSASILLAAQLLFGNSQIENTPPNLVSSNLLSPQQLLMDMSTNGHQNTSSTNSADAGSPSSSNSNEMNGNDAEGAEGVWSADIDQAFHEALQIYPPCGRRKIILSEEGKMYGRNELIARYIKIRCGKTRTRKQVSSHIQVLARKKNREVQSKLKTQDIKSESMPHTSSFGSPKSADSLTAGVTTQISPASTLSTPLFQQATNGLSGLASIKLESKAVDSALAATPAISASQLATTTALQWPYNMVPNIFNNNNFYGHVAAGINNDENLYANFAAALTAQQQINQQFGGNTQSNPAAANPLLSLSGLPALNKILPFSASANLFQQQQNGTSENSLASHTMASSKLTLREFTAYVEQPERIEIVKIPAVIEEPLENIRFDSIKSKFPEFMEKLFIEGPTDAFFLVKCWANLSFDIDPAGIDESNILYAVDSFYESPHNFDISISSKVCSFGKQVVEKVEIYSASEDERNMQPSTSIYHYRLEKSPMCQYMVAFVKELKKLGTSEMNCVLENFTVLQIVQNKQTDETLMVIAFNFEVSPEPEPNCRIFKLVA